MRESTLEKYLVEQVEKHGGMCEKFKSTKRGVPDRIVTWPTGFVHFIETKAPQGRLTSWQRRDHARRSQLGAYVETIWSKAHVDSYIEAVQLR